MDERPPPDREIAVRLNNSSWDLMVSGDVDTESSREDQDRFLYGAYASAYHWRLAGGPANWVRAEHLVSRVASAIGRSDVALWHAQRCIEIIEAHRSEMADWDEPFGYEALARAHAGLGQVEAATAAYERAVALTRGIEDPQDRAVLEDELSRSPWFGLEPTSP